MKKSSEKTFGFVFSFVFLTIGLWPILSNNPIRTWAIIISLILFLAIFFQPKLLKPLNNIWLKFGEFLGKIVPPFVMALVFFFILTPIGLVLRVFGKDLLKTRYSKDNSYWIKRNKNVTSMDKQF
jgi:hypothetical protein